MRYECYKIERSMIIDLLRLQLYIFRNFKLIKETPNYC